jgi:predicted GNAT family N-acyltransferase
VDSLALVFDEFAVSGPVFSRFSFFDDNCTPDFANLKYLRRPASQNFTGMALRMIDHGTNEYQQMVNLRNELLRKPLGLRLEPAELEKEKEDMLMGAFEDEKLLGCCLLTRVDNDTIRLRQMAVANSLQGKGVGRALMIFSENLARDRGYKKLIMHARKTALGFYEKLGYSVSGDEFEEVTIPHYVMGKTL